MILFTRKISIFSKQGVYISYACTMLAVTFHIMIITFVVLGCKSVTVERVMYAFTKAGILRFIQDDIPVYAYVKIDIESVIFQESYQSAE